MGLLFVVVFAIVEVEASGIPMMNEDEWVA